MRADGLKPGFVFCGPRLPEVLPGKQGNSFLVDLPGVLAGEEEPMSSGGPTEIGGARITGAELRVVTLRKRPGEEARSFFAESFDHGGKKVGADVEGDNLRLSEITAPLVFEVPDSES